MTKDDFQKLVKEMRHAQKMFFKTRQQDWLHKSKELERQVDNELSDQKTLL